MDHITTQLDKLAELSNEQVAELKSNILGEFETVEQNDPTPQTVEVMTNLADALDTVRDEEKRREVQAEELAARAAEASVRVRGDGADDDSSEDDSEAPAEDDTEEEEQEFALSASTTADESPELSTETDETASIETPVEAEASAEAEAEVVEESPEASAEAATEEEEASELSTEVEAEAETEVEEPAEAAVESTELSTEEETLEPEAEAETEAAVETPAEAEASNTEETTIEPEAQEEATVTAAADGAFEAPADRRPVVQATVAPVAITAGADIPGYTAGSTLSNMEEVSEAMAKRIHTLRRVNGGDGEQHIVASLTTQYNEDRTLGADAEANSAKIKDVVEPIVAAGGFLAPLEASYDIFGFGTDARPVRDSLPKFQADRGGIRFVTPPVLSSYADAVGIWTEANDIAASDNDGTEGDVVKNSLTVAGAVEQTEMTYAVTLQLQFGNLLTRAYPELVARHNELALIQHARQAEIQLLSKINAKSTAVTTTNIIGFARDFLVQIKRASAAYRSRHRIDPNTQLRAIVPTWVFDAMAADLTLNMPGDGNLDVTRSEIDSFLALSNVSLTASLDQNTFGAQSAGALLEFPDSFTWYLFSEGSFVFLDGGTLDIGIIRDSSLVGTNDYKMFTETFEGVAFVGIESLAITSTISVNGVAAALRDTTGGATAAAIEM